MNIFFIRHWGAPVIRRDPLAGCWFITWHSPKGSKAYELFRIGRVMGLIEPGRWLVKEIIDGSGDDYPPELRVVRSAEILRDREDESERENGREMWEFYRCRAAFLRRLAEVRAAEDRQRAKAKAAEPKP